MASWFFILPNELATQRDSSVMLDHEFYRN